MFSQFNIENIDDIKFVTDRGANIKKALLNNIRLNCSSHLFANVLQTSFEETTELDETIIACKKIVKYFKKANLQHKLNTTLKNACPTRWNSNYTMLKSIVDNWATVSQILSENQQAQRLTHVNISTLTILVELLQDFERTFKELQTCSSPSLCFVLPSIAKITELCEPNTLDISSIAFLKEKIIINVTKIWQENVII